MRLNYEEIELRSEEVQEMLERPPKWMTRWGASLVLALIFMFLFLSYFIKYPDTLSGKLVLTTKNPPIRLYSRTSGKLERIYQKNLATVREGDLIAEIENPVGIESINSLKNFSTEVKSYLENPKKSTLPLESKFTFGDAQNDYNSLIKNLQDYDNLIDNPYYEEKIQRLKDQIALYKELVEVTQNQVDLFKKQLKNAKNKFETDQYLLKEKVYSKIEYLKEEDQMTGRLLENENYQKNIIQSKITISEYEKQLNDLRFDFEEKKRTYLSAISQSLRNIENFTKTWQKSNVITAPISGKVVFIKPLVENQFVRNDDELFAIIPEATDYVGYATVSSEGVGKIKNGQKVRIRFENYPYAQFGNVLGEVTNVSLLAIQDNLGENLYRVTIKLKNGLITSYKRKIKFTPDMPGTAEIITEDLTLLERMFFSIRKIFDN